MDFPITTRDLAIARIVHLGNRMMARYCLHGVGKGSRYDRRRAERWLKDVVRLKCERWDDHIKTLQGKNAALNKWPKK